MLSFLAPAWAAAGLAAVGLPLLAHLLSKTRYREVSFTVTRLVRQAVIDTTRIERPRSLLLLLLRILILSLIVAAFMRPRWLPDAKATDREDGVALIVLIDASASMRRSVSGVMLYDRALREADTLLAALDPSRDVAAVVHVARRASSLLPEPTAQVGLLRDRLANTRPTYENTGWDSALVAAQRLAGLTRRTPHMVIISDQQGEAPALKENLWPLTISEVDHVLIDGPSDNAAVRLSDLRPYPPIVGRLLAAEAEVTNFGHDPRNLTLTATLAEASATRSVVLLPGASRKVVFELPVTRADTQILQVSIVGSDAISLDNSSGAVVRAIDRPRVLVLYADAQFQTLARSVARALEPGEVEGLTLPSAQPVLFTQAAQQIADAAPQTLRSLVVLGEVDAQSLLAREIDAFATRGGGVIRLIHAPAATTGTTVRAAQIDFSLEPLRVFEGPARASLAALNWPGVQPMTPAEGVQPILSTDEGRPIIAAQLLQRGQSITINASLSDEPGGLLAEPTFVVLLNELCRYASPGQALPVPARPGDLLPPSLLSAQRLVRPDETDLKAQSQAVTAPGAYMAVSASDQAIDGVWAQIEPSESDTRPGADWSLSAAPTTPGTSTAGQPGQSTASLAATIRPNPVELWPYLAIGALLLAGAESAALWGFAFNREARA